MTVRPEDVQRSILQVDFVDVERLLTDEEREVRGRVRAFVDEKVVPVAADYWDRAEFPFGLLEPLGELGLMGGDLRPEVRLRRVGQRGLRAGYPGAGPRFR
jgi:glutaryl-CoA dehydrogenase